MAGDDNTSFISSVLDGSTSSEPWGLAEPSNVPVDRQTPPAPDPTQWVGAASVAPATPGSGGGYQFDPETIAKRITDWEQVIDGIKADEIQLRVAQTNVVPPSGDTPASANAKATFNSIQAAIDHNMSMRQYAQSWLDALHKANGTYVENDQDTGKGLSGAASATDGHGLFS